MRQNSKFLRLKSSYHLSFSLIFIPSLVVPPPPAITSLISAFYARCNLEKWSRTPPRAVSSLNIQEYKSILLAAKKVFTISREAFTSWSMPAFPSRRSRYIFSNSFSIFCTDDSFATECSRVTVFCVKLVFLLNINVWRKL